MTLRLASPVTLRCKGVSDTADSSTAFPGAMAKLTDLVPSEDTEDAWVPRPAARQLTNFPDLAPVWVTGGIVVGNLLYGLVSTQAVGGQDTPFCFNLLTQTFLTVDGILGVNRPFSPPQTGLWAPPILAVVGTRIMVAHSGFNGTAKKIGWFDISNFVDALALTTAAGSAVTTAGANVLLRGWQPGLRVNGVGLPGNTTIVSISADGLTVTLQDAAIGTGTNTMAIAGGTTARPLWGAGDTQINALPAVPVSVKQMNGRAYYGVGNGAVISDSLVPTVVTNASQAITFANGVAVTAMGELPLKAYLTGGITQSIIVFQGTAAIQQLTGDPATSLLRNEIKTNTGTLAPLTVLPTNAGLAFMSPEGLRLIDANATVSEPIGRQGQGVAVPFIGAVEPSRMCGAVNADVLRFSTQNGRSPTLPYEEYWYDLSRGTWSGPHTFPASLIWAWGSDFVMSPVAAPATIYRSDVQPDPLSAYVENGVPMTWAYKMALSPDNGGNCMSTMQVSTLMCSLPAGGQLTVIVADDTDSPIDQVFCPPVDAQAQWGAFNFGSGTWTRNLSAFRQRQIPWSKPITFKQMFLKCSGPSQQGVKLGNWYVTVQRVDYTL